MQLQKLKGKIKENRETYETCSKAIGVTVTTFNDKINGKRRFYVEECNDLGEFLGMTNAEKTDVFLS